MNRDFLICLLYLLCAPALCQAADLSLNAYQNQNGEVTCTIQVNDAPQTVKAFSMDIRYDPEALSFISYERGALGAAGYPMFKVHEYGAGVVRIGGVDPLEQGILQGDSGAFVHLNFKVNQSGDSVISFGALKSDMAQWSIANTSLSQRKTAEKDEEQEKDDSTGVEAETDPLSETETMAGASSSFLEEESGWEDSKENDGLSISDAPEDAAPTEAASPARQLIRRGRGLASPGFAQLPRSSEMGDADAAGEESTQAEKARQLYGFASKSDAGAPGAVQAQRLMDGLERRNNPMQTTGRRTLENRPSGQERTPAGGSPAPAVALGSGSRWISMLLAAVLILSMILLAVFTAILIMLVIIYRKIKALEKSGVLTIQGPLVSLAPRASQAPPSP